MTHTLIPLVNMGRNPKNQRHKTPPHLQLKDKSHVYIKL